VTRHDARRRQLPAAGQRARKRIDEMSVRAGWVVQDYKFDQSLRGPGVAVREIVTTAGPADYVLRLCHGRGRGLLRRMHLVVLPRACPPPRPRPALVVAIEIVRRADWVAQKAVNGSPKLTYRPVADRRVGLAVPGAMA
jgi:hypothetical protein